MGTATPGSPSKSPPPVDAMIDEILAEEALDLQGEYSPAEITSYLKMRRYVLLRARLFGKALDFARAYQMRYGRDALYAFADAARN